MTILDQNLVVALSFGDTFEVRAQDGRFLDTGKHLGLEQLTELASDGCEVYVVRADDTVRVVEAEGEPRLATEDEIEMLAENNLHKWPGYYEKPAWATAK